MGLLKSMEQLVSKTNKVLNSFHVNIPTGKVGEILGIEDIEINSLSDIGGAVNEAAGAIALGINMATCAIDVSMWGEVLGNLAFSLSAVALEMAQTIFDAIGAQLRAAFQQVIGTIMNFIMSILNLISTILLLFEAILKLGDWFNIGFKKLEFSKNRENCVNLMSSIAACFLNKLLGPLLDEIEEKALKYINEAGNSVNDFLTKQLEDVNVLSDYIERESFLLKKASIQIKGLSPENVLKYGKD